MHDDMLIEVKDLVKQFSGVYALRGVKLNIRKGEVHALLGENGAGKSTLLKALAGAQPQTSGEIIYRGKPLKLNDTPHKRQMKGIVTIYQEFNLLPNLTVAENMFLGRETLKNKFIVDEKKISILAKEVLDYLKLDIPPNVLVSTLSVAKQQMVEIARALTLDASVIIMDEPSAALSDSEVEILHSIVRRLKKNGISVIYVTHRLKEVFQICDRFTVLQDGSYSGEGNVKDVNIEQIIRMMVGRDVLFERRPIEETSHTHKPVVLEVKNLSRSKPVNDPTGVELKDISFKIHEGEIVGLAGLVGAGRTEIAKCLFGAYKFNGQVIIEGKELKAKSVIDAMKNGISLVPEDRKKEGLFLGLSIKDNLVISNLKAVCNSFFINNKKEHDLVDYYQKSLNIKMASQDLEVGKLSGGNQQKVILSRCMSLTPKILIVDEPTRGIDIGAKSEVHKVIFDLAKQGMAILVISSDMPEVMAISDRIITLCEGEITGDIHGDEATEEKLMSMMIKVDNKSKNNNKKNKQ